MHLLHDNNNDNNNTNNKPEPKYKTPNNHGGICLITGDICKYGVCDVSTCPVKEAYIADNELI